MKIHLTVEKITKLLLLPALLFMSGYVSAQNASVPKTMPPFRILLTTMKYLKADELDKVTPKMIIYFDPTCEHCQAFTKELVQHEKDFAKTQIIMMSYTPIEQVKKFATDFALDKYSNIKVGTEGYTFIVQRYYNIQHFPFIALFDKKGALLASYRDVTPVDELLQKISK